MFRLNIFTVFIYFCSTCFSQILLSNIEGYEEEEEGGEGGEEGRFDPPPPMITDDSPVGGRQVTRDEIGQRILTALKKVGG